MISKQIYCVIVSFNGIQWLAKCLSSLENSSLFLNIIVVDNGSTDGSTNLIVNQFPNAILVQAEENLGFGKANNIGIEIALRNKADFVFLLNQDAWVEPNSIELLVSAMLNNPEFGIVSPMHLNGKGDKLDFRFSRYINPALCEDLYSDIYLKALKKNPYNTPFVNAAAWLISTACLRKVGGFSPSFFHYAEDDNYCHRVLYHNFEIGVVPESRIYHDREHRKNDNSFPEQKKRFLRNVALCLSNPNHSSHVRRVFILLLKECVYDFAFFCRFPTRKSLFQIFNKVGLLFSINYAKLKRNLEVSKTEDGGFLNF